MSSNREVHELIQSLILGNYAGHHCSWCYSPEGIRTKLISAQRADQPRWGDDPEKLQVQARPRRCLTDGGNSGYRVLSSKPWGDIKEY